jgi:PIN domain nuclease of toxin-antitoxin system
VRVLLDTHVWLWLQVSPQKIRDCDPFDRMLIAQAQIEAMPVVTADRSFSAYDVEILDA